MFTTELNTNRLNADAGVAYGLQFVASLDSASLPDMGDRSLDQETHAYIRPRRRNLSGIQNLVRRSKLPFPEPRLPDLGLVKVILEPIARNSDFESEWRQIEENAGLGFIAGDSTRRAGTRPSDVAAMVQGVETAGISVPKSDAVRRACAGQTFVFGPPARDSFIAVQPEFDPSRPMSTIRRAGPAPLSAAKDNVAESQAAPRFGSLEANIARMSQSKSARIAVLAIGVSEAALGKVERLAEILRERHSRKVRVFAAEQLDGLRLAPSLQGNAAGEVSLVACQAGAPKKMLPFLSQFDAVILMVEIGETPVDEASDWADTIRQFEIPIVGVWAA